MIEEALKKKGFLLEQEEWEKKLLQNRDLS